MLKYLKITAVFTVTLRFRATGLFVTFLKNQKCANFWTVTLRSVQSDPYAPCNPTEIESERRTSDGKNIKSFISGEEPPQNLSSLTSWRSHWRRPRLQLGYGWKHFLISHVRRGAIPRSKLQEFFRISLPWRKSFCCIDLEASNFSRKLWHRGVLTGCACDFNWVMAENFICSHLFNVAQIRSESCMNSSESRCSKWRAFAASIFRSFEFLEDCVERKDWNYLIHHWSSINNLFTTSAWSFIFIGQMHGGGNLLSPFGIIRLNWSDELSAFNVVITIV